MFKSSNKKELPDTPLFTASQSPEVRRAEAWLSERLRKMNKGGRWMEEVTITPEMAEILLRRHNARNRNLRPMKIARLKRIIANGRWKMIHQGLALATDGNLNDGQHRLKACIEAGIPIRVRFFFGEPVEDFNCVDTHGARANADALIGETMPKHLAASGRLIVNIEAGDIWNQTALDNDEVPGVVEDHPGIRESLAPGCRAAHKLRGPDSAFTVAHYFIKTVSKHPDRLDEFWDRLCTGQNLRSRDPILVLREAIMKKTLQGLSYRSAGARQVAVAGSIIAAWNKWILRGKTQVASWTQAEPFPEVE